jgi:predicted enzyme related to lactoylglutathione lyase
MGGMHITLVLDCADPEKLSEFWAPALRCRSARSKPPYVILEPEEPGHPYVLLQKVPEPRVGKNRMHLDVDTEDLPGEIERVIGLGATQLSPEPISEFGMTWVVMADPEGNEFCVCASAS